jgi:formylglycine-generating enzyme required for sulfatase activity
LLLALFFILKNNKDNQWLEAYQKEYSEAEEYFSAQDYEGAKYKYMQTLSIIPYDDESDKKETITRRIGYCDNKIKEAEAQKERERIAREQKEQEERERLAREKEEQEEREQQEEESNRVAEVTEINIPMIYVAGGTFTMGCTSEQGNDCDNDEKPAHQVTVSGFNIGKYEVTQAQWEAVMGNNPSAYKGDNLPVECVSWDDVQVFIRKLNQQTGKQYRLPTEAEWEYAARGGTQSRGYKYSGSNTVSEVAWYKDNSGKQTHPVGQKKANELGIYDMSGNVREWCSDWYGKYNSSSQTNPKGSSSDSYRVYRGSNHMYSANDCRVTYRSYDSPNHDDHGLGVRLVLP